MELQIMNYKKSKITIFYVKTKKINLILVENSNY